MFTIIGEMIHADKRMNPQHFGSDLADIRTRTRINPEMRIRINDHISAMAELRSLSALVCIVYLLYLITVCVAPPTTVVLLQPLTTDKTVKAAASNLSFLSSSTSVVGQRHFLLTLFIFITSANKV